MSGDYQIPLALFAPIDELIQLRGSREAFTIHPGSDLARDDDAATPYQVSHAVHRHLDTAVDHLFALKIMVVRAQIIPAYAMFTLIRAATENLATACWVLTPEDRQMRVLRTLQLEAANLQSVVKAERLLPNPPDTVDADRMDKIRAIAGRNQLSMRTIGQKDGWGKIVRTLGIDEASANSAEFLWKACSAFAHGDSWPTHAILEREELDTSTDTVAHLRVTAPMPSLVSILQLVLLFADRTFTLYASRQRA